MVIEFIDNMTFPLLIKEKKPSWTHLKIQSLFPQKSSLSLYSALQSLSSFPLPKFPFCPSPSHPSSSFRKPRPTYINKTKTLQNLTIKMAVLFSTNTLLMLLISTALFTPSAAATFNCSAPATSASPCHALIDYKTPNQTTYSSIKTLFSIKNLRSLLGANDLDPSTPSNQTVSANVTVKIPFSCICENGTGVSKKKPIYTVKPNNTLDYIARELFLGLVTFQEIADINNIPNVDLIKVGQELWIPLPCSCDEVNGKKVVHYGHIVENQSTLELIAEEYGTSKDILTTLNGVNDSTLLAGQVLDVPLQACNSSVTGGSVDYPLLVSNGTYVYTANNCVKCKCDSAKNWILQCDPSGLAPSNNNWSMCPSMSCDSENMSLGNATVAGCNTTTCAYSGFSKQTIFTTLSSASTCPATSPDADNFSSGVGSSWKLFFISLLLFMVSVYPL